MDIKVNTGDNLLKRITSSRYTGILIVVTTISIFLALSSQNFITTGNIRSVLLQASTKGVVAIGIVIVIIGGGCDLSMGSTAALGAMVTAMFLSKTGMTLIPVAVIATLAVGAVCGLFNGILIAHLRLAPFLVTLGTLNIYRGIEYIATKGVAIRGLPVEWISFWNATGSFPPVIVVVVVLAIVMYLLMKFTKFGRYVFAVGGNEVATRLSGINTKRITTYTYVLSGVIASLAGILYVARMMAADPEGCAGYELEGIAAAAIGGASLAGGKGSILGALLGALVLALVSNGLILLNVQSFYQKTFMGVLIIIAVIVDKYANSNE